MSKKMKAAIYQGLEQIALEEVDYSSPAPDHVVLDTKMTGICGSDLHNYFGHWPPSEVWAQGHETCGVVAEVGAGVTRFQPGDKVVVECFSHCGECVYCRTGQYNHCVQRQWVSAENHGGFAEYTTVHNSGLFKLPETMSFEEGALVEPLAVSYRTLTQAQATFQDRVAVIGGGTIGQLCLAVAKAIGVRETLITIKYNQQAQLAEELGADHIVDIRRTTLEDYVKSISGGLGADVVIETVGGGQNFDSALAAMRRRGRVVLVAGYYGPLEVNLGRAVWSEATIIGANCYGYSGMTTDFQAAIDLISSGQVPATKLVTHRFPFAEIDEAFKVAADKKSGAIKVHIYQG